MTAIIPSNNKLHLLYNGKNHILDWGETFPEIYNWNLNACERIGELIEIIYIKDGSVYQRLLILDIPVLKNEHFLYKVIIENPTGIRYIDYRGAIVISKTAIQCKDEIHDTIHGNKVIYWSHGYFITKDCIEGFNTVNIKFIDACWDTKHLGVLGKCDGKRIFIKINNETKEIVDMKR